MFCRYIKIKNGNLISNQESTVNTINFSFQIENTFDQGYFVLLLNKLHQSLYNEVNCIIYDENSNQTILITNAEYFEDQKYYFPVNETLFSLKWYRIEITPSILIENISEIFEFYTITDNIKNHIIQDYLIGLSDFYFQQKYHLKTNNIQALAFISQNYNTLGSYNAIKLYIKQQQDDNEIKVIINHNNTQQNINEILQACWSDSLHYECISNQNSIIFKSRNQNTELILEFNIMLSKFIDNIYIQINNIEQKQNISMFELFTDQQQKILKNNKRNQINQIYRILQSSSIDDIIAEIKDEDIKDYLQSVYYVNESYCQNLLNNTNEIMNEIISNLTQYTNLPLSINDTQLQNNMNNTLNFSKIVEFKSQNQIFQKVLNLTNATQGQIMYYQIIDCQNSTENQSAVKLNNQIQPYNTPLINYLTNINQIVSWNGSFILQNQTGLYQSSSLVDNQMIYDYQTNYRFHDCISLSVSVAGNYSNVLTSICKQYSGNWIMSYNISQTNYSQPINLNNQLFINQPLNFYDSDDNSTLSFKSIKKVYQIQNYIFILGQVNGHNYSNPNNSIFVLNQTSNTFELIKKIQCYNTTPFFNETIDYKNFSKDQIQYSDLIDFNVTMLYNISLEFNNTYMARGIAFYLCENPYQFRYQGFNIINTTEMVFNNLSQGFKYLNCLMLFNNQILQQIFVYRVEYQQLILIITTKNSYSVIFMLSYNPYKPYQDVRDTLQFEKIIGLIPPYQNWTQSNNAQLNNNTLVIQFQNPDYNINSSLAFYSMLDILLQSEQNNQDNISEYIVFMKAGTNTLENQVLFSFSLIDLTFEQVQNDGSMLMGIYSNITNNNVSTFRYYDQILLEIDFTNDIDNNTYCLQGYNQFNNTNSPQLTITPPKILIQKTGIVLISVFLVLILGFTIYLIYLFKKKEKQLLTIKENEQDVQEIELHE